MEIVTGKEVNKNYITQQIWIKKGHRMYGYFQNMTQNAKNMFNTTNFYIRQVYTGLTGNKALQPLQIEVLDTITHNIDKMNDSQLLAYQKKVEKQKSKPEDKQKEIKCNLFEVPFKESPYVDYNFLDSLFKIIAQNDYRSLPTQSSQGIMQTVFQNWKSFYASLKDYKQNPTKYKAKPKIPKYSRVKEKEVLFTNQDCVIKQNRFLKFPKTKQQLNIGKLGLSNGKLKQVRVIPKYNQYVVELVMNVPTEPIEKEDNGRYMSIDLGNDNLATIVTNTGRKPTLIKGKNVKSINQYYNKMKAYFLGILRHGKQTNEGPFTSKRLEHLHLNRFLKIKDVFHKASNIVVKLALEENIHTIIIGQNKGWKQEVNIGKRNNQTFVHIPHRLFIEMVKYKAEQQGIKVYVSEESYTSKASFINGDEIPTYGENNNKKIFSGRRIKRGLYRSKHGLLVNADVNGASNIMKKVVCRLKTDCFFNIETINVWNPQSIII